MRVLKSITEQLGLPQSIKSDNGSMFISKIMDKWAYERIVKLDFSQPGKLTDNANVESFSGLLRQECLCDNWFMSLEDGQTRSSVWRTYYIESRFHSALDWVILAEFVRRCRHFPATTILKESEFSTSECY